MHAWPTITSLLLTMGCTSSAPNMADIQTNTTENVGVNSDLETIDKELNENAKEIIPENVSNTFEVLPTCDNLDENIQLVRKDSSKTIPIQEIEKDDRICNINYENKFSPLYTENSDEKISSLKDIVDQVMLDNILEDIQNSSVQISSDIVNDSVVDESTISDNAEEILENKYTENEDLKETVQKEEINEESASPSQSECSRSTRWEALADIAAELPASLAVDPLTGQIYSLTK